MPEFFLFRRERTGKIIHESCSPKNDRSGRLPFTAMSVGGHCRTHIHNTLYFLYRAKIRQETAHMTDSVFKPIGIIHPKHTEHENNPIQRIVDHRREVKNGWMDNNPHKRHRGMQCHPKRNQKQGENQS